MSATSTGTGDGDGAGTAMKMGRPATWHLFEVWDNAGPVYLETEAAPDKWIPLLNDAGVARTVPAGGGSFAFLAGAGDIRPTQESGGAADWAYAIYKERR